MMEPKNKNFTKYTPEEYLALKGETLYVVEAFHNTGGYLTAEKRFITCEELPHLNSILGIKLHIVDDTLFREEAAEIYQDVYDSEFREWVRRKGIEALTDPDNPTGGYCDCEDQEVFRGMCNKCGKPRERIGG